MNESSRITFTIDAQCSWSGARAATLMTLRSMVKTPVFMPVATQGALRGVDLTQAEQLGFKILLANTYHLLLRLGPELLRKFDGLNSFTKWPHTFLTDSGGFQIFSLAKQLQLSEEGAIFRSYVDGAKVVLTPELSIQTQQAINSDIMMVLDHCIDSTSDEKTTREALALTTRWAKRSLDARADSKQALFGIVQGACFSNLRRESAEQITALPFDGFALGGLAVGETRQEREDIAEFSAPLLPANKPRYLMGVGTPIDLLEAVKRGLDMFDCILPTSLAHQGVCFTSRGKVDLRRGRYKGIDDCLDPKCSCSTCSRYSIAYLNHLIGSGEFVADQLLSIHNLTFYKRLMDEMRQSIVNDTFRTFYSETKPILELVDGRSASTTPVKVTKKGNPQLGDYEIVASKDKSYSSIKQISSGEVMHSVSNPIEEADRLYVKQPAILDRVRNEDREIVVWDVGLGAATNSMTLIKELLATSELQGRCKIISFETDLDPLRLALKHAHLFPHLHHAAPHSLLSKGYWESPSGNITWRLMEGDFRDLYESSPPPDIIWFDLFSPKVNKDVWDIELFSAINKYSSNLISLYTYSASTAVRATFLAAGWWVANGLSSGPKDTTTVAYSSKPTHDVSNLLDLKWLTRWERSQAKLPFDMNSQGTLSIDGDNTEKLNRLLDKIRKHPQFRH